MSSMQTQTLQQACFDTSESATINITFLESLWTVSTAHTHVQSEFGSSLQLGVAADYGACRKHREHSTSQRLPRISLDTLSKIDTLISSKSCPWSPEAALVLHWAALCLRQTTPYQKVTPLTRRTWWPLPRPGRQRRTSVRRMWLPS